MMDPELRYPEVRCQHALIYRNHNDVTALWKVLSECLTCGPSVGGGIF